MSAATSSTIRNRDRGGPLRDAWGGKDMHQSVRVQYDDDQWEILLRIANHALQQNIPVIIEHPRSSFAWRVSSTLAFRGDWPALQHIDLDLCVVDTGPARI